MKPVDRDLVERLLQDETLSFREIARRAECSDWSVRSIARGLAGSAQSYNADAEPTEALTLKDWGIFLGVCALVIGVICFVASRTPPQGGGSMA
jgi:DNA-binding Lrp family transcriptional regulator